MGDVMFAVAVEEGYGYNIIEESWTRNLDTAMQYKNEQDCPEGLVVLRVMEV